MGQGETAGYIDHSDHAGGQSQDDGQGALTFKPGTGSDKTFDRVAPNTLQISVLRKPPAAAREQEVIIRHCASAD